MPIPASSILPTVEDLKERLNVTSTTHDDELQDMLDAAAELVALHVGPLDSTSVTETHYGASGKHPLVLGRAPVLEVTSLTNVNGSTWTADDYTFEGASGLLRLAYAGGYARWSGDVTVTYTVGRESLPGPIREAVLIVAADMWSTQRGNAPSALPVADDLGLPASPNALPAIPPRAFSLLQPYLLGPSVA